MGKHHPKLLNNLESKRREAGLTQAELSKYAGVSRKSINAIENGIYVPSTVLSLKIAATLSSVSYTHLRAQRDRTRSRMPSSA